MKTSIRNRMTALACSLAMLAGMGSSGTLFAEDVNLITNSDFTAGIDDWSMYHHKDAAAEIYAENGMLAMTISELGSVNYAVQLSSNAVALEKDAYYQLQFDISSTQGRYVDAFIQQNGGSYQAYAAQGINLTTEVQTITVTFQMTYDSAEARLVLNCGDHNETLPEHTIYIDNVSLIEVDESQVETYEPYEPPIMTDQVGYQPDAQKIAVFRDISNETEFSVINAETNESVYTGSLYGEFQNTAADEVNWYGDFSEVTEPGRYYITCGSLDASYPFTISETVYDTLLDDTVRMLYLQRCGIAIEDDIFGHPACHTNEATIYGTEQTLEICGGWHDAGDFGRYVVPASKTIADLLLAYDANPEVHSDSVGIPESGNGIPDILDEARYGIEWMLKMQDSGGGVYHMAICDGMPGNVMPDKETGMQYLIPISTTATADLCAIMAMATEYYAEIDADFSARCLEAAKSAWAFLQKNPNLIMNVATDVSEGAYSDTRDGDERYWAACQMYRATGDASYLDAIDAITSTYYKDGLEWHMVGHYGNIALLTMEGVDTSSKHYAKAEEMLLNWVNEYATTSTETGYQTAIDRYTWGSNMSVANAGIVLAIAHRLSGDESYLEMARMQLHYLLGRNPNGICYVTGFGTASPQNPHHRPSIAMGQPMPGMLVGGVNSDLADPAAQKYLADMPAAKCYVDQNGSYSTNEITTYWNSPLIYLLTLATEAHDAAIRGDVNADGAFTVTDIIMMQKWLLCAGDITDWKAGDLCEDGVLNGYDLSIMKRELITANT